MNRSYILELYHKYLAGKASKEERELLLSHYELFDSESDGLDSLSDLEKKVIRDEIEEEIRQKISAAEKTVNSLSKKRYLWMTGITVAASLLIFFSISIVQNTSNKPHVSGSVLSRLTQEKENRLIRLPDGSSVIISAGSKLNYPSSFDGLAKREVYLDGEAYFDVKHNSVKPFVIYTGKLKTTVLGTAFNISAWSDSDDITVTVARGKVKVEDLDNKTIGVITPNHQIKYDKINTHIVEKEVNSPEYLKWKEEDLLLSDVSVAEAAELLEDRYKVKIHISDNQIKSKRFTTIVRKEESLDKILNSISEFNDAVYSYDNDKSSIIINSK